LKGLFTIGLLLICSQVLYGAIDGRYKNVLQRGYEFADGDSVRFPDGSTCQLDDFNAGLCGQKWMTIDYCIPQGAYVWDGPCCEGLVPYLPEGMAGQATCQPIGMEVEFGNIENQDEGWSWWMSFFAGLGMIFALFIGFAIYAKNRK
jgi:hypothetical protein